MNEWVYKTTTHITELASSWNLCGRTRSTQNGTVQGTDAETLCTDYTTPLQSCYGICRFITVRYLVYVTTFSHLHQLRISNLQDDELRKMWKWLWPILSSLEGLRNTMKTINQDSPASWPISMPEPHEYEAGTVQRLVINHCHEKKPTIILYPEPI
jgi:hypothetical protein